ncbi:hypothetical protein QE390_001798 [Siphonobacter sp. SORGH_AS 1065]|nr:hypothetical protein [Siphonobacter sp. SORGH_AS_1065]
MKLYTYLNEVKDGCFFFWRKYTTATILKSQINTAIGAMLIFYYVAIQLLITGLLYHQGIILSNYPLYSIFCFVSIIGLLLVYMLFISPHISKNISTRLTEQEKDIRIRRFLWFTAGGFLLFLGVIFLNQLVFFRF